MDKEFIQANKIFIATLKASRVAGEDEVITGADLQKLRKLNAFNTTKADELQQKVWWDLHFNFASRRRENDREMTPDLILGFCHPGSLFSRTSECYN